MEKVAVSIIVPCYNVEDYVIRCLRSLKQQSLQSIEILIINDGSTDNTALEIQKFLKENQDQRFLYFSQENGGYGCAVNLGIKHSKGEYFAVCEPDDYVDEDYYAILYKVAKDKGYKVVCYNAYIENREYYSQLCLSSYTNQNLNGEITTQDLQNRFLNTNTAIVLCLYSKGFVEDMGIDLPQTCKVYQDVPFVAKIFSTCDKIGLVIGAKYYYTRGRAEQSVANPIRFTELIPAIEDLLEFVEEKEEKLRIDKKYLYGYSLGHLLHRYKMAQMMDAKDALEKISTFLETFLNAKESIANLAIKNSLEECGFNTGKIDVEIPQKQENNFWTLTGIRSFCLNASYEEILSFFSYELLLFQNLNFERRCLGKLEFELDYFMNIPQMRFNSQVVEVLLKLLHSYDGNTLCFTYPKLLAYMSIILKKSLKNELTTPILKLRGDAMEVLENFYDETAINLPQTPFIQLNKKLASLRDDNEEKFLNYIENKKIMVVGNSPVELGKSKGKMIDSFDVVIRFNNFATQGFEKDYGSQTNIWAISPNFASLYQRKITKFDFIISNDSTQIISRMNKTQILKLNLLGIPFFQIATCEFLEISNLRTLSMGLIMILYLLKHKDITKGISCVGFDLKEQNEGVKHYFKTDPHIGTKILFHNWTKEREIFDELILNKRITLC
ncbi:glycosyltransferase family 29 protein [Helicobacter mesocricetorum]|uniref:glycosyltransferase family 29 protein n=1 Tax=Helicobacter mesocricetorum TaxID=87012 RepID=UPI000CF0CBE5|nr:glycosyltransferase family 29 protein [Helicobacter mesocricetorum]